MADAPSGEIKRVQRRVRRTANVPSQGVSEDAVRPVEVEESPPAGSPRFLGLRTVSDREINAFLNQLILMLDAGTPLLRALKTLSVRGKSRSMRFLVTQVADYVENGNALWQAFQRHGDYFDAVFVNMVKASEASGQLVPVLRQLLEEREARAELRNKLIVATIYPTIVLIAFIAVMLFISRVVIPEFKNLFEQSGIELSGYSAWFFNSVNTVTSLPAVIAILAVIVAVVVVYKSLRRNDGTRAQLDALKLRMPIFGPIARSTAVYQMTRNLALMLRSGLSMLVTLDLVRGAVANQAISNMIYKVRESVEQGAGIETPMRSHEHLIPPLITDMLVTGEESGQLEEISDKVAESEREEIEKRIGILGEMLLPILILILAIPVLMLVLALMGPIFELMQGGAGGNL